MDKLKKLKPITLLVLLVAALLAATVVTGYMHHEAGAVGNAVGQMNGKIVGTAIGSAKGCTVGIAEGKEAGEKAGLIAKDTTVDLKESMDGLGNLEVLVAGVTLKNIHKVGEKYTGLYLISGDAVFSVDLQKAEISFSSDGKCVYVTIPQLELKVYLDQASTQTLAEHQKFSLSVSAEDGLIAYLNSMTQTVEKVQDAMGNYFALREEAEIAAKNQVCKLVKMICGNSCDEVNVQFK